MLQHANDNPITPSVIVHKDTAQPAGVPQSVQLAVHDTALYDKPPLPVGRPVNSHLVSVASQISGSVSSADHSAWPVTADPLGRRSVGETSEASTIVKPSLSDGIPPAFETTSTYDGSASAAASGIGRRFSIHLQTGMLLNILHTLLALIALC